MKKTLLKEKGIKFKDENMKGLGTVALVATMTSKEDFYKFYNKVFQDRKSLELFYDLANEGLKDITKESFLTPLSQLAKVKWIGKGKSRNL